MSKALLIDDNPIQLAARELVLRQAGFEVQVATNAESGLALLRSQTKSGEVGVVITDHIMPQASGAEFVRRLRQVNPDIPVIVVSGAAEAEDEYAGLNVTFKQKPVQPEELIALVRKTLGQ